jgi:hypothetical protein
VRRLGVCLAVIAWLMYSNTGAAWANTRNAAGPSSGREPSGCKRVSYTADGGYFSQGRFYREPSDEVTLLTRWCYSNGLVRSHSVRYSTTIANSLNPRISTNESPSKGGAVLDVQVNGTYDSNVINNVGVISIAGDVTGHGHHHFVDASGAGG